MRGDFQKTLIAITNKISCVVIVFGVGPCSHKMIAQKGFHSREKVKMKITEANSTTNDKEGNDMIQTLTILNSLYLLSLTYSHQCYVLLTSVLNDLHT